MTNVLVFLWKSVGLNKIGSIILAIPLTMWLADVGSAIEGQGLNKWAFGLLMLGFLFDSFVGTYAALINEGDGLWGTEFKWSKFLQILNKLILLVFLITLAFLTSLASKNGYSIFNVDISYGGTFIISSTAVTECKSALKKLKKITNSPVVDLLLKLLMIFDEIVPYKKISQYEKSKL